MHSPTRLHYILLFAIVLSGIALRLASFGWNTRLSGDVNLFALTARQWALTGRLEYPMKYEFSNHVTYLTLQTPASQHPPLWPLMGGLLARLFSTNDTFSMLKIIGIVFGALSVLLVFFIGVRIHKPIEGLVAASLAAISPIMTDFSANGSPFILSTIWLMLMTLVLQVPAAARVRDVLAGLLCAAGILTHSSLALLPIVYIAYLVIEQRAKSDGKWLTMKDRSRMPITYHLLSIASSPLSIFLFTFLLALSPWFIWNTLHFGKPFYSYSTFYLLERLGLVNTGIHGDIITTRLDNLVSLTTLQLYGVLLAKSSSAFLREYVQVISPFGLILIATGIFRLYRHERHWLAALLLPPGLYGLTIMLWATYKYRFLVPLIPTSYLLAAIGFTCFLRLISPWRWAGWLCLIGTFVWMMPLYSRPVPTLYYGGETATHAALYDKMRPLAEELGTLPPGVVLGYSQSLDGGIETVYWHGFPFVAGRNLEAEEIRKLVLDFNVRYVWTDDTNMGIVIAIFPAARIILNNPPFHVFEMGQTP